MAKVPQLARIDGDDITKSLLIKAKQDLPNLQAELDIYIIETMTAKAAKPHNPNEYTAEYRN